tara:strand:- start:33995 stop:34684 length:690 start_codon:yes stop_codon:yes gene_type:complete
MKFLESETIEIKSIPDFRICVLGGNKKGYLGYFTKDSFFLITKKGDEIPFAKNQVVFLKITEFSYSEISEAMQKYNEEWLKNFKAELVEKRPKYTAAILTRQSAMELHYAVMKLIPEGWVIHCHHMTTNLGGAVPEIKEHMGNRIKLKIIGIAVSHEHKVMAVKVEHDIYSKNKTKHITIAVDKANGGQAVNSNDISYYTMIEPLTIEAVVDTVLNNGETLLGSEQYKA